MRLQSYLTETSNTQAANINEIMLAYYLADQNWSIVSDSSSLQREVEKSKEQIAAELYEDQRGRSEVMAQEVFKWMRANGYGRIVEVWWTARPNTLSRAVGKPIDSRKNPTDVLVKTSDDKFLGISAKSTKSSGDIGFKNPGIGTIDRALGTNFKKIEDEEIASVLSQNPNIPAGKGDRKKFVRDNEDYHKITLQAGDKVVNRVRDEILNALTSLSQEDLRNHIVFNWMDAEDLFPRYIKVTGHGNSGRYSAEIHDPLSNSTIDYVNQNITLEPIGTNSIGVKGGGKRILKMRVKYESEKLSSGLKLSGDPWK